MIGKININKKDGNIAQCELVRDSNDNLLLTHKFNILKVFTEVEKTKNGYIDEYNISYEECEQAEWELYVFGDEFNDNQKDFIKLAFDCGVESISLWW